jgi:hypothetical protein
MEDLKHLVRIARKEAKGVTLNAKGTKNSQMKIAEDTMKQ